MKKKLFITTTVARTLSFFNGQPREWKRVFDVCAIAAEKDKLATFAEQEGIQYVYLPMHRGISVFSDAWCLLRFILLFIKERPDMVHGNTPKASFLSMLAAWITHIPVRVYMCHGLRYQASKGFMRRVLMTMEWLTCHCATTVIGVSQGVLNQLVSDGLSPKSKTTIIGYGTAGGVDVNYFSRDAIHDRPNVQMELGIPRDSFIFCFIGRIVKDKGIDELIQAFILLLKKHPSSYLLLIGAQENDLDPIDSKTQLIIDTEGHVLALGRRDDVRPFLAISNALVLPSYREGVGQVLLEANSMDVPCITTDIIGPRDVIIPKINGELVEAHNALALYEKMDEWVKHPDLVQSMATKCRELVKKRFDSYLVQKNYFEFYSMLLEK